MRIEWKLTICTQLGLAKISMGVIWKMQFDLGKTKLFQGKNPQAISILAGGELHPKDEQKKIWFCSISVEISALTNSKGFHWISEFTSWWFFKEIGDKIIITEPLFLIDTYLFYNLLPQRGLYIPQVVLQLLKSKRKKIVKEKCQDISSQFLIPLFYIEETSKE